MLQKSVLSLVLLMTVIWLSEAEAQNLVVRTKDGRENARELGSIRKLTFPGNALLLTFNSGPAETFSLPVVAKLFFSFTTGTANMLLQSTPLSIYPNPAGNRLYIQNIPEGPSTVFIYRIDGVMILQKTITGQHEPVSISNLTPGIYILKVNNQALKFIKQ